jgi:hypothetical protein
VDHEALPIEAGALLSLFTSTCGLSLAVSLVAELQKNTYTFPFCDLSTAQVCSKLFANKWA